MEIVNVSTFCVFEIGKNKIQMVSSRKSNIQEIQAMDIIKEALNSRFFAKRLDAQFPNQKGKPCKINPSEKIG